MGKSLSSDSARAGSQKQQKKRRDVQRRTRGSASLPAPASRIPWAELFCPFGAQTLYPFLMLTRMCNPDARSASQPSNG